MADGHPARLRFAADVHRHGLMGTAAAGLAALVDGVIAVLRAGGHPRLPDVAQGILSLAGMLVVPGLLFGVVVGLLVAVIRGAMGREASAPRMPITAPAPGVFAHGLAGAVTLGVFVVLTQRAALHFATAYHNATMAAWAMAAVEVLLVMVAAVLFTLLAAPLRWLSPRLGPLASRLSLGFLLLGAVVAVPVVVFTKSPRLLQAVDWPRLLWGPGAVLLYGLVWLLWPRPRDRSFARIALGFAANVALVGLMLAWVAHAYGTRNRVRSLVEQESASGRTMLRFYANLADRDRDGHAFAFGGGDCNDHDPRIHPGATDKPGDGIDNDCFAGDAKPVDLDMTTGRYGTPPAGLPEHPNFLLIGIDALRPDHLGCFGYDRATSPRMDAFCKESVRFPNTLAQSSRSLRSIPAVFMGKYPSQIAFGPEYLYPSIRRQNDSITESLKKAGYATTAIIGTNYFARIGDFFQGFSDVDQIPMYKPPREAVVNRALATLGNLAEHDDGKPWFMWVHLFHVHEPYLADGAASRFGNASVDKYDTEISYADAQVGRLLDALAQRKLDKNTVVILFSDHGEAFGEHQNRFHSYTLYDEELRATLMVRVPGVAPRTVHDTVALFDIAPTVLNLANLPMPEKTPARSLVPLFAPDATVAGPPRTFISELMPDGLFPFDQKAIHLGNHKLIWWTREGMYQYFDLAKDKGEKRDLSDEDRAGADALLARLRSWISSASRADNLNDEVIAKQRLTEPPKTMDHPVNVRFAPGFTLLGYDMPKTSFRVGDRIPMTFYYRVDQPIAENLFFFVDLLGPGGYRMHDFHAHHYPLNGRYGTQEWRPGEILRDPVEIVVPEGVRVPVTMQVSLAVLSPKKRPVEFSPDPTGKRVLPLGSIRIH